MFARREIDEVCRPASVRPAALSSGILNPIYMYNSQNELLKAAAFTSSSSPGQNV